MAWLARSIANSLLAPEEEEPSSSTAPGTSASPGSSSPPRGVREDLSELTGALANRFQGLASFLAPAAPGGDGAPRVPDPAEIAGLARLTGRQAVADLAKIASSLLPPQGDTDWAEAAVGVTEEVVAFARDAALRHELWLDFPLLPDDADSDDFDMTDAQQDHALAVESVAPELADLRIELCPSHMSEGCFWKIYFVLLHPKLKKEDAEILSTPQGRQSFPYDSYSSRHENMIKMYIRGAGMSVLVTGAEDLKLRILEHNILVFSKYYSRITLKRLADLLCLSLKEAQKHLSDMVNSASLIAKIDRPMGVVSFRTAQDNNGVLNSWATNLEKLLDLLNYEHTC